MTFCLDARTARDHFPGVGRYVFNLARALAPCLDPSERLIVLHDAAPGDSWKLHRLTEAGLQLVDAPISPFDLRQQWHIPRLLRRLGIHTYHSPYYLMPVRSGVPSVVTVHDVIPLRFPHYFGPRDRFIFQAAIRLAVRAARLVIAVSATTASDLTEFVGVPAERLVVIHEAADPEMTPQPETAVASLRTRLSLPERYVLYFGANKPHKNLVRLVEAWARVQPRPEVLVIAGSWDRRYPEARQRVIELGMNDSVRFLGPVAAADVAALYTGALLFVFPSEYEGFGLPVIEAMACGVPVACADTPALTEIAADGARRFDPRDRDAIAATIECVLRDATLRADLAERGRHRAIQFSWTDAARRTLAVYRSMTI
ncbi:MAG TPA: glycosyltransferase family 1 protein [Candidatus Binatia bacterium]|nr:glycosyltransferase family 1 protein [Candidatus Binatia bacterium]